MEGTEAVGIANDLDIDEGEMRSREHMEKLASDTLQPEQLHDGGRRAHDAEYKS